jgi:hypothetical protein
MLDSDINALDRLISQKLLFTNHLGHVVSKGDDLEPHKKKHLHSNQLRCLNQRYWLQRDMPQYQLKQI